MNIPILLIIIGVALLVLGIIAASHYMEKRRTELLKQVADDMGLDFKPQGDAHLHQRMSEFHLFNQGRARKLTNLVVGETDEIKIAIFDYRYTTGSGKHTRTWNQTVASLESPALQVPAFTMRPEGFFDKFGSVFGMQDIDFETHPEFSQMFVLKSEFEDSVRQFFDDSILSFFESKKGISVEAVPGRIIIFSSSKQTRPQDIKSLFENAYQVYGLLVDRISRDETKLG